VDGKPRAIIDSTPGVLFGRIRKNSVVILEDDETEEVEEAYSDFISASTTKDHLEYDVNYHVMEKITRKADRQQKRATVMVTSGALTFILLAAALVTISFLMSPVIEQIFGKVEYSLSGISCSLWPALAMG
jgi:hypothetical protein